jgi:hypothetical protein
MSSSPHATQPRTQLGGQTSITYTMLGIEKPHLTLKVEQTESTFAEGNARW